jgi:gamma-glutamyltranspeptidase/glutathione hydrolase
VLAAIERRDAVAGDGTSMVSAATRDGDAVVVVHSNSFPRFGSGIVVDGYDLVLSNRAGRGFSAEPAHPNFPLPGRRPVTTLHAWALTGADGRPALLGGTPGGENQMPWNAQTLAALLGGSVADPAAVVVAPRWEWLGDDRRLRIEAGFAPDDEAALTHAAAAVGATVEPVPRWSLRSAQQVLGVPVAGAPIVGAVDPRTGGAALPV